MSRQFPGQSITFHQNERPLNTVLLCKGNKTPFKVKRFELKLGKISTDA